MSNRASKSLPIAAHLPKEGFVRLPVIHGALPGWAEYLVGRCEGWTISCSRQVGATRNGVAR
jgi:hypothetical protein